MKQLKKLAKYRIYLFTILSVIDIHYRLTQILVNDVFNNFLVAIGTGMIASALTALLIDRSHEIEQEKLTLCMKKQILYDTLGNLRYWTTYDDEVRMFEFKLKEEYINERIKECRRAVDFCIPYLSEEEYFALSMIETQLRDMQSDIEQLREKDKYTNNKYAYESLFYDDSYAGDLFQVSEYERKITKMYGLNEREAKDIALSVFSFKMRMKLISDNLHKFDYIKIDDF